MPARQFRRQRGRLFITGKFKLGLSSHAFTTPGLPPTRYGSIRYGYCTVTVELTDTVIRYGTVFFKKPSVRIQRMTMNAHYLGSHPLMPSYTRLLSASALRRSQ